MRDIDVPARYGGEEFIRRADQALYKAKDSGRNRTVVFSPTEQAPLG